MHHFCRRCNSSLLLLALFIHLCRLLPFQLWSLTSMPISTGYPRESLSNLLALALHVSGFFRMPIRLFLLTPQQLSLSQDLGDFFIPLSSNCEIQLALELTPGVRGCEYMSMAFLS